MNYYEVFVNRSMVYVVMGNDEEEAKREAEKCVVEEVGEDQAANFPVKIENVTYLGKWG